MLAGAVATGAFCVLSGSKCFFQKTLIETPAYTVKKVDVVKMNRSNF